MTSICIFRTIFRYTVNVENLASTDAESSEIKLSNINWKVKICKTATDFLAVYLVSALKGVDKWLCEAEAVFKLHHKNGRTDKSVVKYLSKQAFSHAKWSHGIEEFMNWNEFLEHFVFDNEATFEIEISTNPLKQILPSDIDQGYVKFRVLIENVSELRTFYTSEIIIRAIKWKFKIQRNGDNFSVFLSARWDGMYPNWSYKVDASVSLLSYDEDITPRKRFFRRCFRRELFHDWGYRTFIGWSDLIDTSKSYVVDDCAILEIEIKVDEPEPQWEIGRCSLFNANSLMQCCVCYDCFSSGNISSTRCGHLFCQPCFNKSIENDPVCSMCKAATSSAELHPVYFT